jgi:feruloyl esterase
VFALSLLALAAAAEGRCAALAGLSVPTLTITEAASVSGTCRITGVASPSAGSRIGFEVRLPERGWTGRYVQIGTGGFAGTIFPGALAAEAARGNVAAMTDTGHVGDRMSAAWAAGNRPAVVDYGHRSIKATADAADRLVRSYYGRPARWRYFVGCSNGGRQGLVAAQRYPGDWDGVLAGSPANPWSEQLRRFAELHYRLRAPGLAGVAAKLPAIQQAALASCPPGQVRDGVAGDPRLCRFHPEAAGLTLGEAAAVRAIVAAGYEPTSAAQADGWSRWITGAQPGQVGFAAQAFRYLLQSRPGWSIADFDAAAARRAAARAAPILDASPDFRRFRAKGGRILSYFGWADALIAPRLALDFYGRSGAAPDFYRLFMIPGMGHCQGGTGAVDFGQSADAPPAAADAEHDIRLALEQWVEQGRAPELLIATDRRTGRQARIAPEPGARR